MLYRINQFIEVLRPAQITPKERKWVQDILPPKAMELFFRQPLAEQRHALDVALDLFHNPLHTPTENLLVAALLHDCGKIQDPLKVWERVYIVLAQKLPTRIYNLLLNSSTLLAKPLHLAENHSFWGAELAKSIGLDEEVIQLIKYHHCPKTPEGILLYEADNRH